jgi:hypothetical protein
MNEWSRKACSAPSSRYNPIIVSANANWARNPSGVSDAPLVEVRGRLCVAGASDTAV